MTVLVVGGGITGLTAAHALGLAGIPTLLVEATDRLGGKVGTERPDGFLVETGPDSFIAYRPAALQLCRELGMADSVIRPNEPRTVTVRTGGRFVRLPDGMGLVLPTRLGPFVTTRMFSPREKLRAGVDLVLPRATPDGDVAVGSILRRRLGDAVVDRLAGPLIGGVYDTPIDELSVDAVLPQVREAEREHRSLLLASLAQGRARRRASSRGSSSAMAGHEGASGVGSGSPFVSLAGGIGQLTDGLVAALHGMTGVEVRTSTRVSALERDGAVVAVTFDDGTRLRPDAIVLTTPATIAAGLLGRIAPLAATHLRTIPHGSTGVVNLGYRLDQIPGALDGHGFLVAEGEPLAISACTWSSRKWAGRAPEGTVLLRAFLGRRASALLAAPDETLVSAVRRDLETTLGVRGEPLLTRVSRFPDLMPRYAVGHLERVAALEAGLSAVPSVLLAGASYRGVGLPDCITQGRAAAARVGDLLGGDATASKSAVTTDTAVSPDVAVPPVPTTASAAGLVAAADQARPGPISLSSGGRRVL